MTSEPVGNGGRMPQIAGNSHKQARAAENTEPVEDRDPVERIIQGRVVKRKAPWYRRMLRGLIAEDVTDMGDLFVSGIIQPAIRNLIWDLGTNALSSTLYGTSAKGQRRIGGPNVMVGGPVTTMRQRVGEALVGNGMPQMTQRDRAMHNFENLQFEDRESAIEVFEALVARIVKYRFATVADLYDYSGVTGSYIDRNWGWSDLSTADIRQYRGGWLLDLPQPEPVR